MSVTSSIQLRRGTGSAVPSSLLEGELAINTDTGHLYYGSSGSDNVVSSSIGATQLFATERISLGVPGTIITGSVEADLLTFRNVEDENLNFNMSAGTPSVANSASFLTSENGFGIILDKDNQHDDRAFFVGHNNSVPALSNYAPLMEISESGAARFFGDITASGHISASSITSSGDISASGTITANSFVGQIFSASNDNINESARANEYFHLVQNSEGKVQQDIKVKVLKITGARMSRIGSRPYTVFDAPGANKAIQISEIILFVKYSSGTGANFPSNGNPERNKLNFYAIPNDGVGASVVPMGAFNRNVVNNGFSRSTVVAKHIPVSQMRLSVNGAIKLRYGRSSGTSLVNIQNSGSDATIMGDQDYFFKIKYRIVDISKDFTPVHTVEGTGTSDTPITP